MEHLRFLHELTILFSNEINRKLTFKLLSDFDRIFYHFVQWMKINDEFFNPMENEK